MLQHKMNEKKLSQVWSPPIKNCWPGNGMGLFWKK